MIAAFLRYFRRLWAVVTWVPRRVVGRIAHRLDRDTLPDFVQDVLSREFDTPEEAMEWFHARRVELTMEQIRHMRRWERLTKLTCYISFVAALVQYGIVIVGFTYAYGALQYVVAAWIFVSQTGSVRTFAESRDRLLTDLENDPDCEVWWYDALSKKHIKGDGL